MKLSKEEEKLEGQYHVSWYIILYKLLLGLIEAGLAITLIIYGQRILNSYYYSLTSELIQDPHDLLANISEKIIPGLLTHNTFFIIYLILLGGVKIAGAIGLIFKRNWGVDLLVSLTAILLPFQIYEIATNFSIFIIIYISVGILIALYLIEFRPKAWVSRIFEKYYLRLRKRY